MGVLQMRTSPVEGRRRALAKELWTWASSAGVSQIVIVGPCAAYMREDADINSVSPLRLAHCGIGDSSDVLTTLLAKAGLAEFVLPLAGTCPPDEVGSETATSTLC